MYHGSYARTLRAQSQIFLLHLAALTSKKKKEIMRNEINKTQLISEMFRKNEGWHRPAKPCGRAAHSATVTKDNRTETSSSAHGGFQQLDEKIHGQALTFLLLLVAPIQTLIQGKQFTRLRFSTSYLCENKLLPCRTQGASNSRKHFMTVFIGLWSFQDFHKVIRILDATMRIKVSIRNEGG